MVSNCISCNELTIERRRKFARRARRYLLAYLALAKFKREASPEDKGTAKEVTMSAALTEKIVKQYKNHRCILDQRRGFIRQVMNEMHTVDKK